MDDVVGETECEKESSFARLMHRIGSGMLSKCGSMDFGCDRSTLAILTSILINVPQLFEALFLPPEFHTTKKDGSKKDVFEEAFGPRAEHQWWAQCAS
jgi:hypothetical protein